MNKLLCQWYGQFLYQFSGEISDISSLALDFSLYYVYMVHIIFFLFKNCVKLHFHQLTNFQPTRSRLVFQCEHFITIDVRRSQGPALPNRVIFAPEHALWLHYTWSKFIIKNKVIIAQIVTCHSLPYSYSKIADQFHFAV